MADTVLYLHPEDIHLEEIDFTDDLPNDSTFTFNAAAIDSEGNAASIILSVAESGMIGQLTLSGMESGDDYIVTCGGTGTDTNLQVNKVIEVRARANTGMY